MGNEKSRTRSIAIGVKEVRKCGRKTLPRGSSVIDLGLWDRPLFAMLVYTRGVQSSKGDPEK